MEAPSCYPAREHYQLGRHQVAIARGGRADVALARGQLGLLHRLLVIVVPLASAVGLRFAFEVDRHGAVTLLGYSLPDVCLWRKLVGSVCPGCGLTRSFIFLAQADFHASWAAHQCGWIVFACLAVATVTTLFSAHKPISPRIRRFLLSIGWLAGLSLVGNWLFATFM